MTNGYIAIHRHLMSSDLWTKETFTRGQAWVDLIMLANHKDGHFRCRGVRVEVKRGQVGYSEVSLAERWKWSRGKVRRFMSELASKTVQQIVQEKNNVTSVITILNYDKYQSNGTVNGTTDGQQTVQQTDTNNNDKNVNKKRKVKRFVPPHAIEVAEYASSIGFKLDGNHFIDSYQRQDWRLANGNKVRDWKACVRTWKHNHLHCSRGNKREEKGTFEKAVQGAFKNEPPIIDVN